MQHTAQGIHAPGFFIALVGISTSRGFLLFIGADGQTEYAASPKNLQKMKQSWYKCGVRYLQSAASACNNISVTSKA